MNMKVDAGIAPNMVEDAARAAAEAIFQRAMASEAGLAGLLGNGVGNGGAIWSPANLDLSQLQDALGEAKDAALNGIFDGPGPAQLDTDVLETRTVDNYGNPAWHAGDFDAKTLRELIEARAGSGQSDALGATDQGADQAVNVQEDDQSITNTENFNLSVERFEQEGTAGGQIPEWIMPKRWDDYTGIDGVELIQNGGFEDHADLNGEPWATLPEVAGWTVTEGSLQIQEGTHEDTPEVHDSQSILRLGGVGGDAGTTIEQPVSVRNAGVHEFKFDFSPRDGAQAQEPSQIEILVNGEVVGTVSSDQVGFEAHEFRVYLPAGDNTVGFREAGAEDSAGVLIDNVSLRRSGAQHPGDVANVDDIPQDVYYPAWLQGLCLPKEPPVMPSLNLDLDIDIDINVTYKERECEPEVEGVVEVTQGRIWGDPHFVGADGGKYDVQGEAGKCYNILSDTGVQMNATFKEFTNPGTTVVEQVGFTTEEGKFTVNSDGTVEIFFENDSGEVGTVLVSSPGEYLHGAVTINDQGHVIVNAGEYEITFDKFDTRVGGFINNIEIRSDDANSDGKLPSGLWGATVDGDGEARNGDAGKGTQGGGAIEGLDGEITERGDKTTVELYEVDNVFDTDFENFNVFQPTFSMNDFEIEIDIDINLGHHSYASVLRSDDPEQQRRPVDAD